MTTERSVDAICDSYVAEYAALDPLLATHLGVAGHDDQLPDLSPAGYAAREELTDRAYAAASASTPVDAARPPPAIPSSSDSASSASSPPPATPAPTSRSSPAPSTTCG